MADKYKLNPITGKLDMVGGDDISGQVADWQNNVTTPTLDIGSTQGLTLMEIIKKMFFKDKMPSLTITSVPRNADIIEQGGSVTPTLTMVATRQTNPLAKIEVYVGNTKKAEYINQDAEISQWTETFTVDAAIAQNTTINVKVFDSKGNATTKEVKYVFGNYKFIGFNSIVALENITWSWLKGIDGTNRLATEKITNETKVTNNGRQRLYVAMPKAWNCSAKNIVDNSMGSWLTGLLVLKGEVTVTNNNGVSIQYSIFESEYSLRDGYSTTLKITN